jgi:hypothetical protein
MHRKGYLVLGRFVVAMTVLMLLAASNTVVRAQIHKPTSAQSCGPDVAGVSCPVGSIENGYLKVEVNGKGQFVITTTGGDPDVIGDENKRLMYDGTISAPPESWDGETEVWGTSFATFRRFFTPFGDWGYRGTNDPNFYYREQSISAPIHDDRITTEWNFFDGCAFRVTQTLSFMENPYTGREDMVRIAYKIERATDADLLPPDLVCRPYLDSARVGVRLMLDTMIGDNDEAPFFVPGLGTTSNQQKFVGDDIPLFFRVFEDPTFAPGSLQAIGHLVRAEATGSRPNPDRFVIANWASIYDRNDHLAPFQDELLWDYPYPDPDGDLPIGGPHGDSAIAIYWNDYPVNDQQNWYSFVFGYGLAPQGGGDQWVDIVSQIINSTTGCFLWVVNNTDQPYTGGVAELTLPPGLTLAGPTAMAASLGSSQTFTQTIGDIAPADVAQVAWRIQVTGAPGTYQFSTQTAFSSGQTFSTTHTVTVQETVRFGQDNYEVDENAGAATITFTRTNSSGNQFTVDYATVDGTATAGSDYTSNAGTLTFAADEITKTVVILITDDAVPDGNETVLLSLSNPTGEVEVLDQGDVTLIIQDDEPAVTGSALFVPLLARAVTCDELVTKQKIWQGDLAVSCDESTKHAGSASLRLHSTNPSIAELYSPLLPVQPNTVYRVSYWVKTDVEIDGADLYGKVIAAEYNSQAVESDEIDENRINAGFTLGESVGGQTEWVTKAYTFTTGADTAYVRLRAVLGGSVGTATGTMWLSDVNLQAD